MSKGELSIRIYYGDVLIHDCVLCRNKDGRIGWYDAVPEIFHDSGDNDTQYIDTGYRPTRADRIRAMSDEELSAFLAQWAQKPLAWKCDEKGELIYWLQQPAEEDDHA
ncbi:hypothetical protein [uncultured Dysosmobacter sp.]|uniref:hypothetical protein n=1 Tax=uncultured Dysosmobacter sp. TaxID=2591384 RepID=UPI0026262CEE|nr:hypothetical protein [uncultured Dysosmobacter sp.]